jgi:hypothetical protein
MISWMKKLASLLLLAALASCDKSDAATGAPGTAPKTGGAETVADVDMLDFGRFDFVERMKLPEQVQRWNGKLIRATGYMNPGRDVRKVKEFELVMNRDSCCYGMRPKMNHFFQVTLKPGTETVFQSDPVTIVGRFVIDEQWDGDWQLGLYWLRDAKVVK